MTAKKKTVIGYVLASLAIIAADQALKAWVVRNIPLNASAAQQRALIPALSISHTSATAASPLACSRADGGCSLRCSRRSASSLCGRSCAISSPRRGSAGLRCSPWPARSATASSRALYGYVVDMFELEFMAFAVFNIADIAINVCCILFVLLMLLRKEPEKPKET